ncbi:membrane fusion protein, adhesin transport system [Onishia taeanensis]|uniref:Membrane fusion protein (MFP) family protein n=1 Tax=Onishia taeanensis TaxID=284577 RepID=A0A1G7VK41_9GAMM|nr:HlyD family type I secretion periplasmic adaptor subunit [Halomonas taeanensis]SDG59921.1 membrane fusion protein, adhesin transport system [Halomonas taeanensis]
MSRKDESSRHAEQKGFEAVGHVSAQGGKVLRPLIDRLFAKRVSAAHLDRDWATDADWARIQQEPLRARALLYGMVLAIVSLMVWAYFAELDEVSRGTGRVIPSSQLQRVQSFDGGVVNAILVEEGEKVEAGQLLMRIDPTRFISTFRENRARAQALQARAARLRALATSSDFDPPETLRAEAPELVAQESALYASGLSALAEQQGVLQERLSQRQAELAEAQSRLATASRELSLASRELTLTRPLLNSGAVSEVEVLRLEREVSRVRGDRNQAQSQVARLESAAEEARAQLREAQAEKRSEWRNQLSETLSELSTLDESSTGLEDRVRLAEIRSPVDGIVQRMTITTIGGVAQPGQDVVEIVPSDDQLLVEARIAPQDIAFLRPGQPATIKLTAYDFAVYGGVPAELEHISADTITDEEGNTFYLVRVKTQTDALNNGLDIIPGMTAEVDILTGKRTVMEYLLKPLLRAQQNALTER